MRERASDIQWQSCQNNSQFFNRNYDSQKGLYLYSTGKSTDGGTD